MAAPVRTFELPVASTVPNKIYTIIPNNEGAAVTVTGGGTIYDTKGNSGTQFGLGNHNLIQSLDFGGIDGFQWVINTWG